MKRCKELEEIRERIKLEFPGVELHQDKSILYFNVSDSIKIYLLIKTWKLYRLCISYDYPGLSGNQFSTITDLKEIRKYINKIEKHNNNIDWNEVF